jgi:hypothetical protein
MVTKKLQFEGHKVYENIFTCRTLNSKVDNMLITSIHFDTDVSELFVPEVLKLLP